MKREAALFAIGVSVLFGQSAGAPTWKEFSIGAPSKGQNSFDQYGMRTSQVTMKKALSRAYDVPEHRILGPDWLATERYAITAQVDDAKDFRPLFQQELVTRFHLLAHKESRDVPVYVLKKGESGSVTQSAPSSAGGRGDLSANSIKVSSSSVKAFADNLADVVERPVFDETGMSGNFDFNLTWKHGNEAALVAAVKDQLGLQLMSERRSVELLIVDHIEKLQLSQ
jgi:uncharacterized protein (TIGR03435 family)